jgi:predicted nucleic-acid-binding protein
MVGVDTNLLVRYITQDGIEAPAVTQHLETHCTVACPGFVSLIVLCELVWVLDRAYGYRRADIAAILGKLLSTAEFEVERSRLAWRALMEYAEGTADFSDYLIGQVAHEFGATPVHTLDRKAGKSPNFLLLGPGLPGRRAR